VKIINAGGFVLNASYDYRESAPRFVVKNKFR